jgi:hypothetical protein
MNKSSDKMMKKGKGIPVSDDPGSWNCFTTLTMH